MEEDNVNIRFWRASVVFMAISSLAAMANALVQPDISAIGDFRAYTGNWKTLDGSSSSCNGNLNLAFKELELAISGYLNPYAKAWVTVSTPGDGLEIEEAYGTIFKGLPLRSELKIGKYLVDFGKQNSNHVHAYPFIDRPLALRVLLGGDGFKDQGVNWNFLLPTGFYSKVSLNILKGDIFGASDTPEDTLAGRNTKQPILSGRWNVFMPIGEKGDIDIGLSGLHGRYKGKGAYGTGNDTVGFRHLCATMIGLDAKYKIRWSDYTSMIIQAEFIANHRNLFNGTFDKVTNFGAFGFVDYRFRKRYNVGFMIDRAPGIYDNTEDDYDQNVPQDQSNTPRAAFDGKNYSMAYSVFTGFSLLEETTLFRLMGQYVDYHIADPTQLVDPSVTHRNSQFTIVLQLIWSLGPHKAHEF
jgi:hypothetical protein